MKIGETEVDTRIQERHDIRQTIKDKQPNSSSLLSTSSNKEKKSDMIKKVFKLALLQFFQV